MMLLRSKAYPLGKYQVRRMTGNWFNFNKSIGFWNHPSCTITAYADWTLRLMFIEIKKWLPERLIGGHNERILLSSRKNK